MVTQFAQVQAGDFHVDATLIQGNCLDTTVFAKGDVVFLDPTDDTWKQALTTTTAKRFGVAFDAAASTPGAAKRPRVIVHGHAIVVAGGAIGPHNRVKPGGTNGRVIEFVEATDAFNTVVGTYAGPASNSEVPATERAGGSQILAAATNDKIWVELT